MLSKGVRGGLWDQWRKFAGNAWGEKRIGHASRVRSSAERGECEILGSREPI